ncbi:MAG TPA: hypothetical protein VM736_11640 [Gemmatimonadales bacterium]|nr:hypothetical protein [Gemmatimonadales bacterium]
MTIRGLILVIVSALGASDLAAQDVAARLAGRVPVDVARAVEAIATDAAAQGLPVGPLIQKAIEGGAKGVPGDRVITAVRTLAGRLKQARDAVHGGGLTAASPDVVEAGADALNVGLLVRHVSDLTRVSRAPFDPAVTLRVAATLTALGIPPEQAARVVEDVIGSGGTPADVSGLPAEVQADLARGATPGQAVERLDRAGQGDGHRGGGAPPPPPPTGGRDKKPHDPTHKP